MDCFLDGEHVWLRCRHRGTYLYADEDGERLSLRPERASVHAAWRVQVFRELGFMIFLQSAAYGRYLASTYYTAHTNHAGLLTGAALRDFNDTIPDSIVWQPIAVESGYAVTLIHVDPTGLRYLLANGPFIPWLTNITSGAVNNHNAMMYWVVEPIPPRPFPPLLPRIADADEEGWRVIRYVRPRYNGIVNETDWRAFLYSGRSVMNLLIDLVLKLRLADTLGITLCVRAGRYARLTPLVIDLPKSEDRLDIVVLMEGDPAIATLQHPDVDYIDNDF